MKLLYFVSGLYNSGGMERVLTEKVNYLHEKYNYEITIITTEQKGRSCFYVLNNNIKLIHLNVNFSELDNMNLIKKAWNNFKKIKKYKQKVVEIISLINPDISISLLGKEIKFIASINDKSKKIGEIHFSKNISKQFLLSHKKGKVWHLLGYIRTNELIHYTKKLDKLVVLTKEDMRDWERTNDNIVQIYNPNPMCVTTTNLIRNNKSAIAVGRLDAQKGFDYLIRTWILVKKKHPDWILNIYGDGEWCNYLKKMIEENQLKEHVFLKGVTTNIEKEYLKNSFFIMSSRYEGFPMVLIEAMSSGLPCISFDCQCGPKEIIEDGINGYLVPMGNLEKLAEKICVLIENEELRAKISHESIKTSEKYDKNIIMQQWNDLFNGFKNKS